jgi:hypothetical protein
MRMDKGAILASMAVIALASVLVGAGTMAWFSTKNVSAESTTFTAGIMSMYHVKTTFNIPANLAPGGDPFRVTFELKNNGNLDILYLATTFTLDRAGSIGKEFADHIKVTGWWEWIPTDNVGGGFWQDNFADPQFIYNLVGDGAEPLTLLEMVQSYTPDEITWHSEHNHQTETFRVLDQFGNWVKSDSDYVTGGGYDQLPGPAIIVGGTYKMEIEFQFMTSAGNNLQGESLVLYTEFFGMQDLSQRP